MTNTELLRKAGWIVKDGWFCNPFLQHRDQPEAIFMVDEVDELPLQQLLRHITVTARNNGFRGGKKDNREFLAQELQGMAKRFLKNEY